MFLDLGLMSMVSLRGGRKSIGRFGILLILGLSDVDLLDLPEGANMFLFEFLRSVSMEILLLVFSIFLNNKNYELI